MLTRLADLEKDALALFDGAKDFVSRLDRPECVAQDDDALAEALAAVVSLPGFECWVVENEGVVVGAIGLLFAPPIWNRRVLGATELFIWAAKDAPPSTFMRLMTQAERRRKELGATYREYVALTSSPPSITRVYAAMGLHKVQESWVGVG